MSTIVVTNLNARKVEATDVITISGTCKLPSFNNSNNVGSAGIGTLVFNATVSKPQSWSGTKWGSIGGGPINTWTDATRAASGSATGEWGFNTSTGHLNIWDGTEWRKVVMQSQGGVPGTDASNPATSAQAIYEADNSFADGLYYIATPDGGTQQIYCINSNSRGWMVMGKFSGDGSSSVANNPIPTARGTVDNSSGTVISCDFGSGVYSYNRFIGCDNITSWENTRNLDFYYGIPSGRQFKNFWTSGQSSGMPRIRRNGFATNGAWDSRGRWSNSGFTFMQMSDTDVTINESYFTSPSNSLHLHNASDAKFDVDSDRSTIGQDEDVMTGFGYDDNTRHFMDIYPNREGNNTNRRDYSSSVYVLLS